MTASTATANGKAETAFFYGFPITAFGNDKEQCTFFMDCHENTSYFLAMTTETATTKDKDNYNDKINFPICQTSNLLPFTSSVLYTYILYYLVFQVAMFMFVFIICSRTGFHSFTGFNKMRIQRRHHSQSFNYCRKLRYNIINFFFSIIF